MRWDALFEDLEAQLDAAERAAGAEEVGERTRAERARVLLADRVRAARGEPVTVVVRGGGLVRGRVADAGLTWLLLDDGAREHLVPSTAVVGVTGLPDHVAPPAGAVLRRLGMGHVLRALARDRAVVRVAAGGATVSGRVDAVGADHLDLALVHPDSLRPTGERRAVPVAALDVVSREQV